MEYLERLRASGMCSGNCWICGKFSNRLEGHHIQYHPPIVRYLCHSCHHNIHYFPQRIPLEKRILIIKLLGYTDPDEIMSRAKNMKPAGRKNMR